MNDPGSILKILCWIFLLTCLFYLAWFDWKYRKIPNRVLILLLLVKCILLCVECTVRENGWRNLIENISMDSWWSSLSFLFAFFLRCDAIGAGDVKLMIVISCYLEGEMALEQSLFSLLFALCYGIFAMIFKKNAVREKFPFAPFALLGAVVVIIKKSIFH